MHFPFYLILVMCPRWGKGVADSGRAFLLDEMLCTWMENNSWAQGSKGPLSVLSWWWGPLWDLRRAELALRVASIGCMAVLLRLKLPPDTLWLAPLSFPSSSLLHPTYQGVLIYFLRQSISGSDMSLLFLETQAHGRQIFGGEEVFWR